MVDISRPWVVDSPLSTRFPVCTRANVGEVASAAPRQATRELGRQVVASATLTAMFEEGLHGLEERLRVSDEPSVRPVIQERWEWYEALSDLEPPFILVH